MKRDAADYGHLVAGAGNKGQRGAVNEATAAPAGVSSPYGALAPPDGAGEDDMEDDRTPGWVGGLGRAPAGTGRGRGRGGRNTGRGRSTGGRSTGRGGRGKKRQKQADSEDDDNSDSGEEYQPKNKSTRKRLPMTR